MHNTTLYYAWWCAKVKVTQSCLTLCHPSMEFSRSEYWNGWSFPSPGDLPNPGIKPRSPALQAGSLPAEPQEKPKNIGVGSLSLLQRIFLTQESTWGLLQSRRIFTNWAFREAQCAKDWTKKKKNSLLRLLLQNTLLFKSSIRKTTTVERN